MEVAIQFLLGSNLGRREFQQRMNKWGEESIRCKPYFILFLNKGIACRNNRTVNTTACAAGSLPIEKPSDQLRLVLLLNPTTSKCLPWIYLRIIWFTTHCRPHLSRVIWKECVPPPQYLDQAFRKRSRSKWCTLGYMVMPIRAGLWLTPWTDLKVFQGLPWRSNG